MTHTPAIPSGFFSTSELRPCTKCQAMPPHTVLRCDHDNHMAGYQCSGCGDYWGDWFASLKDPTRG